MRAKNLKLRKHKTEVVKFEYRPGDGFDECPDVISGVNGSAARSPSTSPTRRSRPCIKVTERSEVERAVRDCEVN